jgi:hypothetical protein
MIGVLAASLRKKEGFDIMVSPLLRRESVPPFKKNELCGKF